MLRTNDIIKYFPFKEFRPYQREVLENIKNDFENEVEIIVLDAPVGFGKSPVNIALGNYFKPTFYTTPQIKLVKQLSNDFCPKALAVDGGAGNCISFLGRRNYICKKTNSESDICIYRNGVEKEVEDYYGYTRTVNITCSSIDNCTYNEQKKALLKSDIGIITFAMLIINSYNKFFPKRNLLIVDECHNLENQIANLFAGFTISEKILPRSFGNVLKNNLWNDISKKLPNSKDINDYLPFFDNFKEIKEKIIKYNINDRDRDKLETISRKIDNMLTEINDERNWVIDIKTQENNKSLHFSPILVDNYLQERLWNQADKIILTSATIPYRSHIKKWLRKIGLGDKTYKMYKIPMTFPIKNRKIITEYMSGKMTYNEEKRNWNKAVNNIKLIIKNHKNEKGVIHTQSYKRAIKIFNDLKGYNVFLHEQGNGNDNIIKKWIISKKQILVSPSIKDGVDLKDDLCRFQILLKIPYPNIGNSRVSYILKKKKDRAWYIEQTIKDIVQMYGRAIRSPTDHAMFYIVDSSFNDLPKRNFPKWFLEGFS